MSINKKGYMITPIIFITLFLIAVIFTLYESNIDADTAAGIRISASIEKGVTDIYKKQIEQVNFAKLAAYECSQDYCYNITEGLSSPGLRRCINDSLNITYENSTWDISVTNDSTRYYLNFSLSAFNITNINMSSDRKYVNTELNTKFLNRCS